MESEAKYLLVGTFVIVFVAMIIGAVLWLSDASGTRSVKFYTVYFKKHSLEGLQRESQVTMKGIKVGTVNDYHISPRSVEEVRLTLKLEKDTPIKIDTRAALRRNLLSGLGWVELAGATDQSAPLLDAPKGEKYPVIPEGQTELEKIADSIPELIDQMGSLAQRVTEVISDENVQSIKTSIKNIETATSALAENRDRFTSILKNFDAVMADIRSTSASLSDFTKSADKTLDDVGDKSAAALEAVESAIKSLDKETAAISSSVRGAAQVFSQEVTSVSQSLSDAANTFSTTMEGFEDPHTIITGPRKTLLGPGEELRK